MDLTATSGIKNLERYKNDLCKLMDFGMLLSDAMLIKCYPNENLEEFFRKIKGVKNIKDYIKNLPDFYLSYQDWYSESLSIIKFLLPDRLNDFTRQYEIPNGRNKVDYSSYVIEDYLNGIKQIGVVSYDAAIPRFQQQRSILRSCYKRFTSSLFDIKRMLQADIFGSELEAAQELIDKGFYRPAGTLIGVVLESNFAQICERHSLNLPRKNPSINDYNELLKKEEIITLNDYKHVSLLGDIRNLCCHWKDEEPTKDHLDTLMAGTVQILERIS